MAGDHDGAPFLVLAGDRDIEDPIQAFDDSGDAAALLRVETRIARRAVDVASADHIRAAKKHDRVAVAVSVRNVNELQGFAVDEQRPLLGEVCVARPGRSRRLGPRRRAHACEHVDVRDDTGLAALAARIERVDEAHVRACARHRLVAARVLGVGARVDDVADRFRAELRDRSEQLVADRRRLRIDDHDGLVPDLHGRVAARARDHEHVALRRQNLELGLREHGLGGRESQQYGEGSRADGLGPATHRAAPSMARRSRRAYSGYIVCAPPRAASTGTPWRCEYSSRNVFVPGK